MVKMCYILYLDCLCGEQKQPSDLGKRYRKKAMRSRKYNARYIKVPVWYNNSRLILFFVRLGPVGKWKALLTNDLDLGFNKMMETFHIRWSVEVFFKDAKQYLQLGKCQCNNFDSRIGATTLAMM